MPVPADLAALPKAEVHVHLEGSVRPATLEEFCAREGVSISQAFTNLNSFVETYMAATRVMTKPGDYHRLVREYAEDAARAGVRYAELEVSPALGPRILDCFREAAETAARQRDVILRLVLGLGRVMPSELKQQALDAMSGVPGLAASPRRSGEACASPPTQARTWGPHPSAARSTPSSPTASSTASARSKIRRW